MMIKFSKYILIYFFSFFILLTNAVAKKIEIYDSEYLEQFFNSENQNIKESKLLKKCYDDIDEIKQKLVNNQISLGEFDLQYFNLNSLLCYFQNNNMIYAEDNLLYFLDQYNKNKIIPDSDIDVAFRFFVIPYAHSQFPNLNLIDMISVDEIKEYVAEASLLEIDVATKNLLIHSGVLNLYMKGNKDEAFKFLKNGVIDTDTEMKHWTSIMIQGDYSLFYEGENKVKNNIKTINLINKYLDSSYHSQLDWLRSVYINNTGYLLRKLNKFEEAQSFLENYIEYDELNKLDPSMLMEYLEIVDDIGRLKERTFKGMNSDKQYGFGFEDFRKGTKLYFEKIIENDDYFININDFEDNLSDIDSLIRNFIYSRMYYYGEILPTINSISEQDKIKMYWDDFDLTLKGHQLLMSHEVGRSLDYLENKIFSQNKNSKKIYKEKINLEDDLKNLKNDLLNASSKDSEIIMNKYMSTKSNLKVTENKLSKLSYKYDGFQDIKYRSFNEIYSYINDDEAILIINRGTFGYNIQALSKNFNWAWYINDIDNFKKIKDYINNPYSEFPYKESHELYKSLRLDQINEENYNNNKIKHIYIYANEEVTAFPFWLLLSKLPNKFSLQNLNSYSWFSKNYSYSILPSLNYFVLNKKLHRWTLGIQFDQTSLEILSVQEGSNADKKGIRKKDKIIEINNTKIEDFNSFRSTFDNISSSSNFEMKLLRNNKIITKKFYSKDNVSNPLEIPEKIISKILSAKEYDFVGIGDPVLSNSNNFTSEQVNSFFADYQTRGSADVEALRNLPSLPETRDELINIQSNFKINKTKLFLGEEANEINLKKANLSNTKYIVFASHGLVNGEIDSYSEPGIVLTPPKKTSIDNDGLLTASEIMNMDLNNADLVVLSACNTSAAKNENSVALSGLAKSFFVAGAKSLIVSGWPVESESATFLSSNTFKEITNNNEKHGFALQKTINKMINQNMDPLLWAPFMLIGINY